MTLTKFQKVFLIILGSFVVVIAIAIVAINLVLGAVIEGKIRSALDDNKDANYSLDIEGASFNILSGNIRLKGLSVIPDSSFLEKVKNGEAHTSTAYNIYIPVFRLVGIGIYDAVVHQDVQLRKIELKKALIQILKGKKIDTPKKVQTPEEKTKFNPDSIFIAGLQGFKIDKIEFKKFKVYVVDLETEEIIREQKNLGIEIRGIELDKISDSLDLFTLNTDAAVIEFPKQEFNLPGGYYKLGFKHLKITPADSLIVLQGLKLKTIYSDKYEMAKKLHFTSEIFDIGLEELRVINLDFGKAVTEGSIYIDTVFVSGLNLALLMDKRLPFNEAKRPKLPNQLVKGLNFPLYVDHIIIENSELLYQEKMPDHEKPMTAILGDLNVHIRRATSIRDSIMTRKPMTMNLKSKLMKKPWMEVDFVFPLYRANDTFFYSGQLAGAKLSIFNDAAFPAIGVKFIDGHLDGITFKGSANPNFSKGEFTMLYTNLKAEVVKKDQVSKNKFVTWAANAALRNANPGKNGTTRVAKMEFERVIYKGFGNIIWKTLQSGIMNTISPVGKNVKEDKSKKKAQKKADDPEPEQEQKKKKKKRDKKK